MPVTHGGRRAHSALRLPRRAGSNSSGFDDVGVNLLAPLPLKIVSFNPLSCDAVFPAVYDFRTFGPGRSGGLLRSEAA